MIPDTIRKAVLRAIDEDGNRDTVAITCADIFNCFEKKFDLVCGYCGVREGHAENCPTRNVIRWQVSLLLRTLLTEGLIRQSKEGLKLTAAGRNALSRQN